MIELNNVVKKFDNRMILSNLSLSIAKNEFVCITGESGSGKTTLLNIIGLLEQPDDGQVILEGHHYSSKKDILKLRQQYFGYIFQDYLLMQEKTVEENLSVSKVYCKNWEKNSLNKALESVGLSARYLKQKVYQLSGGEQQKLAIARMMLKPCELILADEPTGNLDEKNKKEIIALFKTLQQNGKTIVCVTHDKEVSQSADRIIHLKKFHEISFL